MRKVQPLCFCTYLDGCTTDAEERWSRGISLLHPAGGVEPETPHRTLLEGEDRKELAVKMATHGIRFRLNATSSTRISPLPVGLNAVEQPVPAALSARTLKFACSTPLVILLRFAALRILRGVNGSREEPPQRHIYVYPPALAAKKTLKKW